MECKQMYNSGLRVYLLDNYNWMDFTLLSLYLASYALRFLVDHWIKDTENLLHSTERARQALYARNWTLYDELKEEIEKNPRAYFTRACKFCVSFAQLFQDIGYSAKLVKFSITWHYHSWKLELTPFHFYNTYPGIPTCLLNFTFPFFSTV